LLILLCDWTMRSRRSACTHSRVIRKSSRAHLLSARSARLSSRRCFMSLLPANGVPDPVPRIPRAPRKTRRSASLEISQPWAAIAQASASSLRCLTAARLQTAEFIRAQHDLAGKLLRCQQCFLGRAAEARYSIQPVIANSTSRGCSAPSRCARQPPAGAHVQGVEYRAGRPRIAATSSASSQASCAKSNGS
jgi:hypothetical protein